MQHIITATDFSEVAENAVHYACRIAQAFDSRITVLHSFVIPVMFSDIPLPGSLITDAQNDAELQMQKVLERIQMSYPGLPVEGKVVYGNTVDALDELTDNDNYPWLVVVGNSNLGENSHWPDSVLMDAFRKLAYPVLAVPPGCTYHDVKNLCFAFDNKHKGNEAALGQLTAFTKKLQAGLHVLNIQPGAEKQEIDADAKNALSVLDPQYHVVYGQADIDNAIGEFNNKNEVDWLIMIPRKHSFFEGLFHKSHTKSVTHSSRIPILALHENTDA